MLAVRGCRPLVTPAIGDLLIPRFAVRHPGTVESLVHYMHPDGRPGSNNSQNALLSAGRGGDGDNGWRRIVENYPPAGCQWGSNKWVGYQS